MPIQELASPQQPPLRTPVASETSGGILSDLLPQEPRVLAEQGAPAAPVEPAAPTPFATSLKLTPEQQAKFMAYVDARVPEIMREMGLNRDFTVQPGSWADIRRRNSDSYDLDYRWRIESGSIFEQSNFSLGTNIRHARYIGARVQDDLLGTTPFFSAIGKTPDKAELARQAEQYVQDRIEDTTVREGLREAQMIALVVNESVVKTTWARDATKYRGPATVMVGDDGQPLRTKAKGLLIYENDNFLPSPIVQPNPDGSPALLLLEKDPSFQMQPGQYQTQRIDDLEQETVHYEGTRADPIDYRCFLCPLTVPSLHDADLIAHVYRQPTTRLKEQYGDKDEVSQRYFTNYGSLTGEKQPRVAEGEQFNRDRSGVFMETSVAEVFVRFDANEDGHAEEIWLIKDFDRQGVESAIFYDYTANHFGKRPFEAIPGLEQVRGRWYGRGIFSLNHDDELAIDVEYNRAKVRGARSSSVTFYSRGAVKEWDNGIPPVIGGNTIWEAQEGYDNKTRPPIWKVNLAEEIDKPLELINLSTQAADQKVGAISGKDASADNLNQSKTATGIVNLQAASDVITKQTEQAQAKHINACLEQIVELELEHMDPTVLMLDKNATALVTLNRDEIRSLPKNVRLTLTRSRSSQMQAVNQSAAQIVGTYWGVYRQDPEQAKAVRPFYISQLKGLEVNDADEALPEVTDQYLQQWQAKQGPPPQPPSKSISAKLTDLAPSERAQVLQSEGITPASPAELAAEAQKQAAAEAAKRPQPNEQPHSPEPNQPHGSRAAAA